MSTQEDLEAAIAYIKSRGLPIGRIMAVVNTTRKLDAELARSMEAGEVAAQIDAQIEQSKKGRRFLDHSA